MDKFLTLSASARAAAIQETAARMQLHTTPVEKDFWVCWLLREMFSLPSVDKHLIFKGGTSLSKAYGVIQRFSEDIDLSVLATVFGVEIETNFDRLTKSQKDNRIKTLYRSARPFINDTLIPELRGRVEERLGGMEWSLELAGVKRDLHILNFHYPRVTPASGQFRYARPTVRIELSARAEHEPAEIRTVTPYVAEQFEQLFDHAGTSIKVLAAQRTFWEKVTLLHAESSRPADESLPPRLARHLYDLHQLMASGIGEDALQETDLLERIARHKAFFYPQARVDYEKAYSGNLQIVPNAERQEELKRDYTAMRDFFMDKPPDFDHILTSLKQIEVRTNESQ